MTLTFDDDATWADAPLLPVGMEKIKSAMEGTVAKYAVAMAA